MTIARHTDTDMTSSIDIKSVPQCRWDLLSLGEVMLRLDPGPMRIHTTRHFNAWEGGGEYNVARGLRRCFGLRTGVLTALADNPVGRLIEDLMLQGGIDISEVRWLEYDGVGRNVRNGINFTEPGFGPRPAVGCSDRGNSAASQLKAGDFDWERLLGEQKARWLHSGGIFAALSEDAPAVVARAFEVARSHGTVVSYDLNYRSSLWKNFGGKVRAQAINRELVKSVDVLFGNEEDFSAALGFNVEETDNEFTVLDTAHFRKMIEAVTAAYPNLSAIATTLRSAKTASFNGWGAIAWFKGKFYETDLNEIQILDRVGGGDSFASGFIYGLLSEKGPEWALRCGVSHGALAMSTPGDTSMATLAEVERLMKGSAARIER